MNRPIDEAKKLRQLSLLALHTGDIMDAERLVNEAIGISQDYGDHQGIVGGLVIQARIARFHGDRTQAELSSSEALRWHRIYVAFTPVLS